MKKLLCLLLSLLLVLSFAACESEDEDDDRRSSRRSKKDTTSQEEGPEQTSSGGYEAAIEQLVKVMSGEISKNELKKMFPQECWDYFEEEDGMTLDDCYEMISEDLEEQKADLEDEFGKNYKVTYEILSKNDVPDEEFDEFKNIMDEKFGVKESAFGPCYEVEIAATISGTEEETDEGSWHVVEIDGTWYIAEILIEGF